MATANLIKESYQINDGLDGIVIVNALGDLPGGRALNVSSSTLSALTVIKAGHVIIKLSTGDYAPMPLNQAGTAYASLPASASYVGVLKSTIPVSNPQAAIVTMGQINQSACPYTITDAMKTALKGIQWLY